MTIEEVTQAIQQRVDALAAADPTCNRLLGRLDILKEMAAVEADEDGLDAAPGLTPAADDEKET